MPCKSTWLLLAAAVFAIAATTSYADEPTKVRPSLQQETDEAFSHLTDACNEAWKYDNLRRVILTAAWPDPSHPPQIPAVQSFPPAAPTIAGSSEKSVTGARSTPPEKNAWRNEAKSNYSQSPAGPTRTSKTKSIM